MNKQELQKLRIEVIKNKLLYEEVLKRYSSDFDLQMKQKNLSLDRERDIDKSIDLEMELSEKYKTDAFYKKWTGNADTFIIEGLKYLLEHKPGSATKDQIETPEDLLRIFQDDPSKLIIYREQALGILFRYDELQVTNTKPLCKI